MTPSTASKKIRRRPVAVDSSGQHDLVALLGHGAPMAGPEAETAARAAAGSRRPIRFNRPDPRGILIGAVRLDEYLKAAKIEWPFVIERTLAGQDWVTFEARYSAEGRPGYAPQPMVGLVIAGIMNGTDSLRGLEEMADTNLGTMGVTGGICPDHSVIDRFVLLHAETLTESFFANVRLEFKLHLAAYNLSHAVALAGTVLLLIFGALAASRTAGRSRIRSPTHKRWALRWLAKHVLALPAQPGFASAQP